LPFSKFILEDFVLGISHLMRQSEFHLKYLYKKLLNAD